MIVCGRAISNGRTARAVAQTLTLLGLGMMVMAATAQSAPQAVPVGMVSGLAGYGVVPLATNACAGSIANTNGSNYGDNCPAGYPGGSQLSSPQGVAVDKYGNVYVADYSDHLVRVVYYGGASVAALITAASSGYAISATKNAPAPVPTVGYVYTIAGFGGSTTAALTAVNGSGQFYCANYAGTSNPVALNNLGDGCPAASAPIGARDVVLDSDGNIFLTDFTDDRIRVLCVNCAATTKAAQLIALENPGVTPVNAAMYTIAGYSVGYRDGPGYANATSATSTVALFRSPTQAVLSSSDDVFIADNLDNAVRLLYNGGAVATAILTAEGVTAPVLGNTYTIVGTGCVQAPSTTSGSATTYECLTVVPGTGFTPESASVGTLTATGLVWSVYLDANSNLYYTSVPTAATTRVKVLYGGIAPPLTFPNATYTTLKTGYTYSFAGQGGGTAGQQDGVAPSAVTMSSAQGVSGDANGNIFFIDYLTGLIYETYAQTGIAAIIAGGSTVTAATGAYCNGGTTGPVMTDAYYNGCPATQVKFASPRGPVVADSSGNLYFGDSVGYFVRKFSYNPTFPATAVGSTSASQPYAFTFLSAQTLTANSLLVGGATASGFKDVGPDTCATALSAVAGAPGTTCVVNVAFAPQVPGLVAGAVELNATSGVLGETEFSGRGTGAALLVDPGTSTTVGTTLTPAGIAVDGAGRVLVADTKSKSVLRYAAGVATTLASGFTAPSGVAIDGAGDLFVTDSSANTVTEVPVTGTKFVLTSAVSAPLGLATDGTGNLYVADKGNNRVLMFGPNATNPVTMGFSGLSAPVAVAADYAGTVYVADSSHIVKLTNLGVQTTVATVVATGLGVDAAGDVVATVGTVLNEYPASGATGVTLSSGLTTPKAVALDAAGDVYIADSGAVGYIELQRTAGYYKFPTSPATTTINLTSSGTASLTGSTFTQTDTTDFSIVPATSNGCSGALTSGTSCALTASFNPLVGGTLTDVATFSSNAVNATPIILTLTGTTAVQTTTTTLAVASTTLVYGNVQTLTATVTGALTTPANGSVNFYNNLTSLIGTANVGTNGVASYPYVPVVGTYSVTAVYVPSGLAYTASTSSAKSYTVTPALLTVTATNVSRFYNTANPPLTYTISGFVNNDPPSVVTGAPVETTTAVTTSPAGTYPITITQGTLAAANYVFTLVNGTLTITGATVQTITFGALPNVTYGVAPIALSATSTSGLTVAFTATGPATVTGTTLTVTGAGQVCVTANQAGNNTYAGATPVTQCFTSAKAPLTVTATSVSRVYGAANPTLAYAMTGFVDADSQVTATSGAPGETTTAVVTSGVGTYPITLTLATLTSTNYAITLVNGTLTVTPATLTLVANSATRLYGAVNPTFSGTISGQVNGDVLTETFSTTATQLSPVGTYPITPGATGTNVGNYTLAITAGTLTITQATPGILLTGTPTTGYQGTTTITLTATLTTPTAGIPTTTVNFMVAGAVVATATLNGSGVATYATVNLPIGADSVTAVYVGDTNFKSVTSNAVLITISAGFGVIPPSSTALAYQKNYQETQALLTVNPGGTTYTLAFACQGLPAKVGCTFTPSTLPLTGVFGAQTVQMLVSNSQATGSIRGTPQLSATRGIMLAVLPLGSLLLFGLRRRRMAMLLAIVLLSLGAMTALSGCGSSPTADEQASGTYPFTVTVTSGSTTLQTIPFTLTIP